MKTIFKALFFFVALALAFSVFAQSDFEAKKARAKAGNAAAQYQVAFLSISESLRWKRAIKKQSSFIFKLHHNDGK
jgi:hypothetical protein